MFKRDDFCDILMTNVNNGIFYVDITFFHEKTLIFVDESRRMCGF